MKRHRILVDALKSKGVNVVMGRFKEKDMHCKVCNADFKVKEEKMTDVNGALYKSALLMTCKPIRENQCFQES